jgi:hypothetical protein
MIVKEIVWTNTGLEPRLKQWRRRPNRRRRSK